VKYRESPRTRNFQRKFVAEDKVILYPTEIKGPLSVAKKLDYKTLIVITKDTEDQEEKEGIEINYIPLWKWLLMDKNVGM